MGGAEFVGRVVSNRMQKSVVVAVSYAVWVPKYKVYQKRISRIMAHDEQQECVTGDVVRIHVTQKISKMKNYNVTQILRRAHIFDATAAAQLVQRRDLSQPQDAVAFAEARVAEVSERLAALRRLYEEQLGSGVSMSTLGTGTGNTKRSLASGAAALLSSPSSSGSSGDGDRSSASPDSSSSSHPDTRSGSNSSSSTIPGASGSSSSSSKGAALVAKLIAHITGGASQAAVGRNQEPIFRYPGLGANSSIAPPDAPGIASDWGANSSNVSSSSRSSGYLGTTGPGFGAVRGPGSSSSGSNSMDGLLGDGAAVGSSRGGSVSSGAVVEVSGIPGLREDGGFSDPAGAIDGYNRFAKVRRNGGRQWKAQNKNKLAEWKFGVGRKSR